MQWVAIAAMILAADPPFVKENEALKKALAGRDPAATALAARQLDRAASLAAPLEVFDGQALSAPPEGLGIFDPLPSGIARNEEIFLYAQVRNHTPRPLAGGWFELHLVSDLIVLDADGNELARDMAFGESKFTARAEHRDTFVAIALRVKGLPKGSYRVRLVVHDQASGRAGQVEISFSMP
jgi:hypothetical protein